MKSLFMKRLFKVILAFLFSSSSMAQDEQSDELNILFIGNSYTHMYEMPFIFDKIARSKGKPVHVEMNTRSSATFNIHTTRTDMFEAINSRKWDYVVLQGFSRELSHPRETIDSASMPYFTQIVDSIKANHSLTNLLLYNTWGYRDGYQHREETDTYEKMSEMIVDGYKYLSETFDIPIVPVGQVWRKLREKHPDINLYDKDLAHPSKKGSYLAASTFFAALFKESPLGAKTSTIRNKFATVIQQMAGDYVLANFDKYRLNQDFFKLNWSVTESGAYFLKGESNFESATKLTWNFGDGNTSSENYVEYNYKEAGDYNVVLTVEDTLGTRIILRRVHFTEPKKPKKKPFLQPQKGNKHRKKS